MTRIRSIPSALALAGMVVTVAPVSAQPAALVAQFRGNVKVVAAVDGSVVPARVGLRLALGDSVDVPAGSRATLLYNNGRLVAATSSQRVAPVGGPGAQAIHARAAASLAEARRAARPDSAAGIGRPPPAGAHPLEPVRSTAVLALRPTFRWQAQEGSDSYLLQLRPVAGGPPRRYTVEGAGPWTLPDSAAALEPGAEYAWTVVPSGGGRIPGEERFRVLDPEGRRALDDFRAGLAEAGLDPDADGLFLTAAFFADLGLLHDALAAVRGLRAAMPDEATDPVVDLLEARVLDGLGRTEEALAAFDRAGRGSD